MFATAAGSLQKIYEQYHDQIQFINIYIREAHARDAWWLGDGVIGKVMRRLFSRAAYDVDDPRNSAERHEVASQCRLALHLDMLMLVDDEDDSTNEAYAAHPTRFYFIDEQGRVVYAGGVGPFGLRPWELKKAIGDYLARS